jgi:hypothetical protein
MGCKAFHGMYGGLWHDEQLICKQHSTDITVASTTVTRTTSDVVVWLRACCQQGVSLVCCFDAVAAAAAANADISPYCDEAPINVPQSGGSTFDKWEWIDACFSTPRGSNCTSTFACKGGGGPITARCNVTGLWEYLSGECAVPPAICSSAPSSVPTSGGASFLSEVWKTQCGQKKEGETCTVINAACSTNGNITAKCTKVNRTSAAWTDIQGACNARKLTVTTHVITLRCHGEASYGACHPGHVLPSITFALHLCRAMPTDVIISGGRAHQ